MARKWDYSAILRVTTGIVVVLMSLSLTACKPKHHESGDKSNSTATSKQSAGPVQPSIVYKTVKVDGIGNSLDDAIQSALTLAVEQVNGTRVSKTVNSESLLGDYHAQGSSQSQAQGSDSANYHADADISARVSGSGGSASVHETGSEKASENASAKDEFSSKGSESGSFSSNDSIVNVSSSASGVVRRFQVSSQRQQKGIFYVTVVAEIPVYQASQASKRLKITVLPFRLASQNSNAINFEKSLRSEVIDGLTQSGKVAILDRDYTEEDQGELSKLQGEDFSKDEASKIGNKLGADYIIVGTVSKADLSQDSVYMEAAGKRVFGATHVNAEVTIRMIEAATGVVQFSATVDTPDGVVNNLDAAAKAESTNITNRVIDYLFPLRIEAVSNGIFYLGRGGDSMHVGDVYQVIQQGDAIRDSDTNEIIGYSEKELAPVVVTDVEAKLSKATIIGGGAVQANGATGLIARRIRAPENQVSESTSEAGTAKSNEVDSQKKPMKRQQANNQKNGPAKPKGNDQPKEGVDF